MKKFLNVLAFAILTIGLFALGIIEASFLGSDVVELAKDAGVNLVNQFPTQIGLCIFGFTAGVASAIATIASFFTSKTKEVKESKE